jgi:hypothetical protein
LPQATALEGLERDCVAVLVLTIDEVKASFAFAEPRAVLGEIADRLYLAGHLIGSQKRPIGALNKLPRLRIIRPLNVLSPQLHADFTQVRVTKHGLDEFDRNAATRNRLDAGNTCKAARCAGDLCRLLLRLEHWHCGSR